MQQQKQFTAINQIQNQQPTILKRPQQFPQQQFKKQQQQFIKKLQNYQIFMNLILGEGQFGKVHLALDERSSQQEPLYYAVKVISLRGVGDQTLFNPNSMLKKEIEVLKKAKHKNLVCLQEIQQSPNNLYIFLDYCNGGDLRGYLKSKKNQLSYEETVDFLKQIVAGYEALHNESIIHRDLKPENILMNDGQLKIGDFGFGRIMDGDLNQQVRMSRKCTPIYGSPQILQGINYSSKCDVWSLGIIFYELLIGKWPFYAQTEAMLVQDIIKKVGKKQKINVPTKQNQFITPECIDLLQRMLMYEENDRISWVDIFKHPLIVGKQEDEHILNDIDENEVIEECDKLMHKSIIDNKKKVIKDHLVRDIPSIKEKTKIFEQIPKVPYIVKKASEQENTINNNLQQNMTPKNQQNTEIQQNQTQQQQQQQTQLQQQQQQIQQQQQLPQQQQNQIQIPKQENQEQKKIQQDLFPQEEKTIPKYQVQLMNVKQKEMEKLVSNKSDKIMLFLRNRALYANVSLQNLWDARKQLNLPNFIIKGLIYCQGGYYYLCLKNLKAWITEELKCPIIKEEDFKIYQKSEYFQKTYNTIIKDFQESNNFFEPFQKVIPKELQKELFEAKKNQTYEDDVLSDMEKFIRFIKSSPQEKESYIFMAQVLIIRLLNFTSIPTLNYKALKAVYGVQIFSQLEVYQPLKQYQEFDFRKFYLEEINSSTEEQFRSKILLYNQKYIIPQIQKQKQYQQQQQQQQQQMQQKIN